MPFRRLFLLVVVLAPIPASVALAQGAPESEQARMDRVFQRLGDQFIADGRADGVSIAVVRNGQPHFYDFGTTTRGKDKPPTADSVYEIGSVSKMFNALILAHAVLEGKINLQDDIRRYLPGDYPNLAWEGTPVRIVDLVTTTSALPDNLPNPFPVGADPDKAPFIAIDAMKRITPNQVYDELKQAQPQARHTDAALQSRAGAHGPHPRESLRRVVPKPGGALYRETAGHADGVRKKPGIPGGRRLQQAPRRHAAHV